MRDGLMNLAARLRERSAETDGLVLVSNMQLEGVDDFVIVPADHATIARSCDGCPPAAWETIKTRLAD
jgi:hypothetical protein